jgi:hypothetical protein
MGQVQQAFRSLGNDASDEAVRDAMTAMDIDQDGEVSMGEFRQYWRAVAEAPGKGEEASPRPKARGRGGGGSPGCCASPPAVRTVSRSSLIIIIIFFSLFFFAAWIGPPCDA